MWKIHASLDLHRRPLTPTAAAMSGSSEVNTGEPKEVVPLNTRVLISNFKLAYNMLRRPDGTFDRHLDEFLDRKVPPNSIPVAGVLSFDLLIHRRLLARIYRPSSDLSISSGAASSLRSPPPSAPFPVILFFHGGSFAHSTASTAIYDSLCRRLVSLCSPAIVVSVDYRRSPEHRYPCAYDDGWAALRWAAAEPWLRGGRFFLAGDSSGGNIAHHVAVRAAAEGGGPVVAGNILLNPMFGGERRTESEESLDGKYFVTVRDRDWYWRAFLPEGEDRDHPACNPFGPRGRGLAGAAAAGFARSLVVVAGLDLMRDWQRGYVEGLREAGKEVRFVYREKATVGFYLIPNTDHFREVMEEIRAFVESTMHEMQSA